MELRNAQATNDPRLDRIRQVDLRTLNYRVSVVLEENQYADLVPTVWELLTHLDQGAEGACVGFGFSHEIAAAPFIGTVDDAFARTHYLEIQKIDPWPGGAYPGADPFYEGTSVISGAQHFTNIGYFTEYRWALDIYDLAAAIVHIGPAVIGVDWYSDMFDTDANGFIHATGTIQGGHCVCVNEVYPVFGAENQLDIEATYFAGPNSWGTDWGVGGYWKLTMADMMKLFSGGDFCVPVTRVLPGL